MRTCGTCTMCCKLLHIRELDKPAGVWCRSCNPGEGCTIYATRPQVCRDFECMWLQEECIPESLRPDKSHVILWVDETGDKLFVSVDPNYPDAWKNKEMRELLDTMYMGVDNPKIGVIVGKDKFAYVPSQSITQ